MRNNFVASLDLEFQIGYSYRKGWIDKKTKKIEDSLQLIYDQIENKSKYMFDLRERQRKEEEEARLIAVEKSKVDTLVMNVSDFKKANEMDPLFSED